MTSILKLAFQSVFDIDGAAARQYMNGYAKASRRNVSPAWAFRAVGDYLRLGIKTAWRNHPELKTGAAYHEQN
ncbi:MAG: hypothetical protein IJ667_05485 [Synergistaceae bacterium]|nr:hypothetical protein [Synergistaceae bacterium]